MPDQSQEITHAVCGVDTYQGIEHLGAYDIAIINPSKKLEAYDLIMKYKNPNQVVIRKKVKYEKTTWIGFKEFRNSDNVDVWHHFDYTLNIGDKIFSFKNKDRASHMGIYFFEPDECLDFTEAFSSKDSFTKRAYSIIDAYIVYEKGPEYSLLLS